MAGKGKLVLQVQRERERRLFIWNLRSEPFGGTSREEKSKRRAYEGGFMTRVEDVNQGRGRSELPVLLLPALREPWRRGYDHAAKQDGLA